MIESQKSNFERTVLVGVINDSQNEEKLNEFLEELEFLSVTALSLIHISEPTRR